MYSPYGSYSSLSSLSQPLEIAPSSYLASPNAYHANCAFPSWPQRSSLSNESSGRPCMPERASSYLSDDDLLDLEDDAHSIASGSSSAASRSPINMMSDGELLAMQLEKEALQREAAKRFLLQERERRRQQATQKRGHRSSGGSKKSSPKSKSSAMAPISEGAE
jgi:hypothetical protein